MAEDAEQAALDDLEAKKQTYGNLMTKAAYQARLKAIMKQFAPKKATTSKNLAGKETMDWPDNKDYVLIKDEDDFDKAWLHVKSKLKGKSIHLDLPRGGTQEKWMREAKVKWQRRIIKVDESTSHRVRMMQVSAGMKYAIGTAKVKEEAEAEGEGEEDGEEEAPPAAAPAPEPQAPVEAPEAPNPRNGRPQRAKPGSSDEGGEGRGAKRPRGK